MARVVEAGASPGQIHPCVNRNKCKESFFSCEKKARAVEAGASLKKRWRKFSVTQKGEKDLVLFMLVIDCRVGHEHGKDLAVVLFELKSKEE